MFEVSNRKLMKYGSGEYGTRFKKIHAIKNVLVAQFARPTKTKVTNTNFSSLSAYFLAM